MTAATETIRVLLFASYAERLGSRVRRGADPSARHRAEVLERVRSLPGGNELPSRPLCALQSCSRLAGPRGDQGRRDRAAAAARWRMTVAFLTTDPIDLLPLLAAVQSPARGPRWRRRSSGSSATITTAVASSASSIPPTLRWSKPSARASSRRPSRRLAGGDRPAASRGPTRGRRYGDRRRGGLGTPCRRLRYVPLRGKRSEAEAPNLETGVLRRRDPAMGRSYGSRSLDSSGVGMNGPIRDLFERPLGSLRVSVTDRCNMRCRYCMPQAEYIWLPRESILTFEEIDRLVGIFTTLGVSRSVRLTGGEPLLRHDLPRPRLAASDSHGSLTDIALTTNGILLGPPRRAAPG